MPVDTLLLPSITQQSPNTEILLYKIYLAMLNGYTFPSNTRTIAYTIGAPGVAGCDYNFTSAANTNEQSIQLGATNIIPASSPIISMVAKCMTSTNGSIGATVDIGKTSGSSEYMSEIDLNAVDEINSVSAQVVADPAASSVWFSMIPDANWNTMTAGKWKVYVTFTDNSIL